MCFPLFYFLFPLMTRDSLSDLHPLPGYCWAGEWIVEKEARITDEEGYAHTHTNAHPVSDP